MEPSAPETTAGTTPTPQGSSSRERKLAVCTGAGNWNPADRAEMLVMLLGDADTEVALQAGVALNGLPPEAFVDALKRDEAIIGLFEYASSNLVGEAGVA